MIWARDSETVRTHPFREKAPLMLYPAVSQDRQRVPGMIYGLPSAVTHVYSQLGNPLARSMSNRLRVRRSPSRLFEVELLTAEITVVNVREQRSISLQARKEYLLVYVLSGS